MSFYTDASLVLIPSGIKDQKVYCAKPVDGTGDLSFSRASNATRVNSSGLVEKVRTNLAIQSNSFSTSWSATNATLTSGQSGYDGTNDAWSLLGSGSNARIDISNTSTGLLTFSVYAKAGTSDFTRLRVDYGAAYVDRYFNLSTGALGGTFFAPIDSKIESVGGGWYRCSITLSQSINTIRIYVADVDLGGSASGNILIQAVQLESGDIMTDYIATTSAAVSVGPVSGLPRLDYSGGASCPSLLLEPQRTNVADWSEDFSKWLGSLSVTTNFATSPDGYQNADKLTASATNDTKYRNFGGNANCTASIFAKKVDSDYILISYGSPSSIYAIFRLTDGVCTTATAGITTTSQDYGNGWWRFSLVTTTQSNGYIELCPNSSATARNASGSCLVWGAQYENLASYASSYIPTLSSGVTRVADAASKTGISSLIGSSEGTLFFEGTFTRLDPDSRISITDGSYSNFLYLRSQANGSLEFLSSTTLSLQSASGVVAANTTYKIAVAYKLNDCAMYVNGVQVATDTSATMATGLSRFGFDMVSSGANPFFGKVAQTLLFPTRLSNSSLASLTTL